MSNLNSNGPDQRRELLVKEQLESRGITDPLVLDAMRSVHRELFVPAEFRDQAYEDRPLPIGHGQTISQPFIVAYMIEALRLKGGERILEVGAGAGYAAAVASKIAREVFAIERIGELAEIAKRNLAEAGCENVYVKHGDGTLGWPEKAPFDAILVSAGAPEVPQELVGQLGVGGRLVVPVGSNPRSQDLLRVTRTTATSTDQEDLGEVRFVPLIGEAGWCLDRAEQGLF